MNFLYVAEIFNLIEVEQSRLSMTKILSGLFTKSTSAEASIIAYLSLGELNPVYIGTQFNIAEKTILSVISKLLELPITEIAALVKQKGDIGLLVETSRWVKSSGTDLTLIAVYSELEKIHAVSGTGSQEIKEEMLLNLIKSLDSLSAKYVLRIILAKLRLGFSDMTLLDAFSWMKTGDKSLREDLENAYNISADIGLIIKVLKEEGIEGIKRMHIIPGIPIRPAAAERMADAKSIIEKLGICAAQPKLDGFRLQIHLYFEQGQQEVRFYSRNLQNMSEMFPDLSYVVKQLDVKSFVAEGEAIAYEPETGIFLPFQETVKRKRKHEIEAAAKEFPLKLFLFDLLYLNDESFLNKTHKERRAALINLLKTNKVDHERLEVIEEVIVDNSKDLEKYFNNNISAGLEGLVVKKIDSTYRPGKRNFNWIKYKREESGELDDTIDCVVLGYYSGHGKRASFGIGAFLVGIYNPKADNFETIAKIGTGLTDAAWIDLKEKCDHISVPTKPKNVSCAKELEPDVWVDPTIVCAIRADEITLSPIHTAAKTEKNLGFALRFPRIMSYRPDKSATDATTVEEVNELYQLQFQKKSKTQI